MGRGKKGEKKGDGGDFFCGLTFFRRGWGRGREVSVREEEEGRGKKREEGDEREEREEGRDREGGKVK